MGLRTRKFFGILLTILYMTVYALVTMAIGGQFIVGNGMLLELGYYVLMGFAWIPGAAIIIKWMSRPDAA